MMDRLLQGVLQGEFPVGSAVQWMNGDESVSPPAHLLPHKFQSAWQSDIPTPEGFKSFVLNYVRDQAEFILSAAEKKGRTSRGGTPQPSGPNTFESGAPVTRSKRTDAEHLRQLESVARRLDPGAVDEMNFPSLGGSATNSSKRSSSTTRQQKPHVAAIAPKQMKPIVAMPVHVGNSVGTGGGNVTGASSSGDTLRRRIQPTQVAEVEVSKKFVTAQLVEPAPAGGNLSSITAASITSSTSTSKLASRLGAMGLDDDESNNNPFKSSNTATAATKSQTLAKEITPQKEASSIGSKTMEFSTPLTNKLSFGDQPITSSSSSAAAAAAAAVVPAPHSSSPSAIISGAVVSPQAAPLAPRILPLSASGHALAALHAGILCRASNISLTTEINLLLNLFAVPLTTEVDHALVACPELGVLLTCGVQSQQYAALVLQHSGGLLKGLGLQLLDEIAAAAAATATALLELSDGILPYANNVTIPSVNSPQREFIEEMKSGGLPTPIQVMNTFKKIASAAEIELRSKQLRTEKPFNRVPAAASRNSIAGSVGLHAFTADGVRSRSVEDQRRVSNREACRDAFFALMRDAASRAAFFGRNKSNTGGNGGGGGFQNNAAAPGAGGPVSVSLSLVSGADCRSHTGEPDGVVFGRIQVAASNLLRTLRPDNFHAFAELLTAAILQAAATGDALMDEELTKLAKRDGVSKFHSLNRRMQGGESGGGGSAGGGGGAGGSGVGPRRGNPMTLSRLNSSGSTSIGFGNNNTMSSTLNGEGGTKKLPISPFKQQNNSSGNTNNVNNRNLQTQRGVGGGASGNSNAYGGQSYKKNTGGSGYNNNGNSNTMLNHNTNSQLPAGAQAAMDEAAACAAGIMSEFPRALGLYILFLEAADSHRLNAALTRVMTEKLKSLAKPQAATAAAAGQSLGEKVVAASALAGILGYLAFAKNNASAKPASWDSGNEEKKVNKVPKYDGSHPVDIAGALRASLGTSHVLRTVPWVTRYLHFLKWDSEAVQAPYFKSVLSMLGNLKCSPELAPGGHGFGPAALCLRSLLDDFSATVLPFPTPENGGSNLSAVQFQSPTNMSSTSHFADSAFGTALTSSDQSIDLRYVDLCCPVLAHARRLFASEGGAVLRSEPRRILPTAPLATTAAVAPPLPSATEKQPSLLSSPYSDSEDRSTAQRRQKQDQQGDVVTSSTTNASSSNLLVKKKSTLSTSTNMKTTALDPVKLRLQQTFLQQYSQEDKLVKLKDVVEYCSDVIGCNAATATVAKLAPAAIKTASDELITLVTKYAEESESSANAASTTTSIEQQQIELERFSNAAAERATAATIKKVLYAAFEAAQEPIKLASTRAVLGLVSSELGDAVIATAAAMVAETAAEACGSRLPALVQKAIRQDDLAGHAKSAVKTIIKERKKLQSTDPVANSTS